MVKRPREGRQVSVIFTAQIAETEYCVLCTTTPYVLQQNLSVRGTKKCHIKNPPLHPSARPPDQTATVKKPLFL